MNKDSVKYVNNILLSKYIGTLAKPKKNDSIFDGNVKVNSFLLSIIKENEVDINNCYGNQIYSNDIVNLELYLLTKKIFDIKNNNILMKDFNINSFDLIVFDLYNDIHNITHASCCDKVKKLKISIFQYSFLYFCCYWRSLRYR